MPIVYGGAIYGIGGGGGGSGGGGGISGLTTGVIPKAASATTLNDSLLSQGTNVIEQVSGTNAQTFRVYSTYSGAGANYERLSLSTTAGSGVTIAAESAGTGADALILGLDALSPGSSILMRTRNAGDSFTSSVSISNNGVITITSAFGSTINLGGAYAIDVSGMSLALRGDAAFGALVSGAVSLNSGTVISWSPSEWYNANDLFLARDAAGTLAQRNATNAQTLRVYGTYTDASNYVRASLAATGTAVTLAAETAGTGTDDVDVNVTAAGAGKIKLNSQLLKTAFDTAPANASDTGTAGEVRITATHIYVCTATNTWVRAALATW